LFEYLSVDKGLDGINDGDGDGGDDDGGGGGGDVGELRHESLQRCWFSHRLHFQRRLDV